ncbi:hypothetical protein BFP76_10775 [Amylibacter kogurei]|uniref:Polysaccharide chain length determinant N-terminal domain-containing protein n=1 Tax=Paramylibacter kogurei TaxID=1889778 RepID=A0A2G5KCH2_9RHOB|nr:lipopolysaccharide biosynthesis protein [Amylibacter kogurei]PIB26732.1 hypothetical protein BFP76_10775 [Amylibacter kogurei]
MDLKYFASIFLRRLPYFLLVSCLISAISIIIAKALPPAYESQMKLIVESPQIPTELATPTISTPAMEQLQIVEQRLMTRNNLLDIAARFKLFDADDEMTPDRTVESMLKRTTIRKSANHNEAALMTIAFEAATPEQAASVVNEYLTLIQKEDVESRTGRATQTLEFFEQEVTRLSQELAAKSAEILKFKLDNSDALPDSLDFRLGQQTRAQERLAQINRDMSQFNQQREKLMMIFAQTGEVTDVTPKELSRDEEWLEKLRADLAQALAVYAPDNPNVKVLEARIAQTEKAISRQKAAENPTANTNVDSTGNMMLDIQLSEMDTRLAILEDQRDATEELLDDIVKTLSKTPANAIRLDELELDLGNLQTQYTAAVNRFGSASTGERIELLSQGQKISVIEPPALPDEPTKPNRMLIAGGGTFVGIMAGIVLVVALEMLNRSIRRPEDLVAKLGITPLATIPYIRSRQQMIAQRSWKIIVILAILIGVPSLIYAVHTYYLPLDLLMETLLSKLGL